MRQDPFGILPDGTQARLFTLVTPKGLVMKVTDYGTIIEEMLANQGDLTAETRRKLALKVFRHTSQYDTAIAEYFTRTTK